MLLHWNNDCFNFSFHNLHFRAHLFTQLEIHSVTVRNHLYTLKSSREESNVCMRLTISLQISDSSLSSRAGRAFMTKLREIVETLSCQMQMWYYIRLLYCIFKDLFLKCKKGELNWHHCFPAHLLNSRYNDWDNELTWFFVLMLSEHNSITDLSADRVSSSLNLDLVEEMYSLKSCATVCTQWRKKSFSEKFWHTVLRLLCTQNKPVSFFHLCYLCFLKQRSVTGVFLSKDSDADKGSKGTGK